VLTVRAPTTRTAVEVAAVSGWLAASDLASGTLVQAAALLLGAVVVLVAALLFVPSEGPMRRLTQLLALLRGERPPSRG
jgi:hypothetical protein